MTDHDSNSLHLPWPTLAAAVIGATAIVGGLAATACWMADVQPATSGAFGLVTALAGAFVGITPWVLKPNTNPVTAALQQVAAASIRMLVGLSGALALALATDASRPWLFGVFLVATLAGLIAELVVLTPILRAANASATTTPETAA